MISSASPEFMGIESADLRAVRFADSEQTTRERRRKGEELQFWLESRAGLNPLLGLPCGLFAFKARNADGLGLSLPRDLPKKGSQVSAALARIESDLWPGTQRFP